MKEYLKGILSKESDNSSKRLQSMICLFLAIFAFASLYFVKDAVAKHIVEAFYGFLGAMLGLQGFSMWARK